MTKAYWLLRAGLIVLLVVACLLTLLWLFQRRLIYLPNTASAGPAASTLPTARDVTLHTADGLDLQAWYVPPTGADRGFTVLVANGNAGNRAGRADLARALAGRGFAVLLFDYRGYGGNPGRPSESGLALDARAAYSYLVEDAGVGPDRLIYFGESLGCAVVVALALDHPPAGMLLRSPFADLPAAAAVHFPIVPVRAMLRDRFPVADQIGRVDVPTTVVYGTADSVVPAEQSIAVAGAAAGPVERVAVQGADHNDAVLAGAPVIDAVSQLADRIVAHR